MNTRMLMLPFVLAGMGMAGAADEEMTPPLGLAFPLTEQSPDGVVRVLFPVAINPTAIVRPEAILRVIYVQPQRGDAAVAEARQKTNMENVVSKDNAPRKEEPQSPEMEAARKIANETIWPSPVNFRLALENLPGDKRLVYFVPGEGRLHQESFYFPQGLLLGEKDGAVIILSVEKSSPGDKAGVVAGDAVFGIGGTPLQGKLERFFEVESKAREEASTKGAKSVLWTIRAAKGGQEKTVEFRLPLSLHGSLLDLN